MASRHWHYGIMIVQRASHRGQPAGREIRRVSGTRWGGGRGGPAQARARRLPCNAQDEEGRTGNWQQGGCPGGGPAPTWFSSIQSSASCTAFSTFSLSAASSFSLSLSVTDCKEEGAGWGGWV